ncbi:hypothetical protein BGX34_000525 [Mortierella sp. NVP85]|nr:hypothetical protein BGX34_000525 [Mortierella sp. NVP85]
MASKQRKRKHSRKEQSNRDKARTLMSDTTYAEPLREYHSFLDHLKSHGYARDEFTRIPFNLIDLAAAVLASMITGQELSLFGGDINRNQNRQDPGQNQHGGQRESQGHQQHEQQQRNPDSSPENDQADIFYFIQRILKRTQLSCTTLILALIYIDRFKARLARTMKRRTRLDQGPDYDPIHHTNTTPLWPRIVGSDKGMLASSDASSCSSPISQSPSSSSSTTLTHRSRGSIGSSSKNGQESWSSISLFLVAAICADKYLFDATYSNAEWADFTRGQYTTTELNDLERRFLGHLQYKLYVSEPEFDGFLTYLEVILALKQVWGRGLITFSYSDVRILTQRLLPAYAGRLHFKTLQGDMLAIVWQVVTALSRIYLTIMGTIIIAAASYTAVVELSGMVMNRTGSQPYDVFPPSLALFSFDTRPVPHWGCADHHRATPFDSQHSERDFSQRPFYDEDASYSAMNWAFTPSAVVQCAG